MRFTFRYDVRWGRGGKLQPHHNGEIMAHGADEAAARAAAHAQLLARFAAQAGNHLRVDVQACLTRHFHLELHLRGATGEGEVYATFRPDPMTGDRTAAAAFIRSLESVGFRVTPADI